MKRINDLLKEIREILSKYDVSLDKPAFENVLIELEEKCKELFNYKLPEVYISLLKLHNGIDENGIVLYSADNSNGIFDFISSNLAWRQNNENRKIIVFAESGDDLYIHNLRNGKYEIVDRITQDEYESYDNCESLMISILENMI